MSEIEFQSVPRYFCHGCQRWVTLDPCPACMARIGRALRLPLPGPPGPSRGAAIPVYVPTPAEIAENAAEVRATWTAEEEVDHRAVRPVPATIPQGITLTVE